MKKIKPLLYAALAVSAAFYPGFMDMMSAAGWLYNVREGNYPECFRVWAVWMYIGGALVCVAALLAMAGSRLWRLNYAAIGCSAAGLTACMIVLEQFCAYADQNFSGVRETMQPVSELYRDRIAPTILPAVLAAALAFRHLLCRKPAEQEASEILNES